MSAAARPVRGDGPGRRRSPATTRATFLRRRAVALLVVAALVALIVVLVTAPGSRSQAGGYVRPLPVLGPADPQTELLGAVTSGGEPGEVWGYRRLAPGVPPATVGGRRLEHGPLAAGSDRPQLAFLRHTDATGWQVFDTPLDADGQPTRGPDPNPLSARMTPKGGGVLVGDDETRESGSRLVLLVRDPGGRWTERETPVPTAPPAPATPTPPATPDAPAAPVAPDAPAVPETTTTTTATTATTATAPVAAAGATPRADAEREPVLRDTERLAADEGAGRLALAAFDQDGRTQLFAAAVGPQLERAILRYDGTAWTREPIRFPASVTRARVVALDATEPGNAFALLDTNASENAGVELYRRVGTGAEAEWTRVGLQAPVFADAATPDQGITDVTTLGGNADPLTVTARGAWIDGALKDSGTERTFTLFYDIDRARVTGSWCDAQVCARPLNVTLSPDAGYRSFAFAGDGFGTRVVTNPLDPGEAEESNRGTYLRFAGETFERRRGATGQRRITGAFASLDDGWLQGPVRIAAQPRPQHLTRWPVALRSVLTAATPAPNTTPGALDGQALAVGADGAVARYVPGSGWTREFLLTSAGAVSRPRLRGVAWPEPGRAHAVGDAGAMWQWRADTGLWERDPAAPIGFESQLMDVAFQPGRPERGYAVGRDGTLLRYDKTWLQDPLPAGFEHADLTSVTFAGGQALVAAGTDLLVNDGSGWRVDDGLRQLLATLGGAPSLRVVRGLPDGGAVVGGRGIVAERDSATAPWRFTDQPLVDQTVVAAAPMRDGGRVRALVSVVPRVQFPLLNDPGAVDPSLPQPIFPPQPLAPDGYLLRESATGWRDEQGTAFESTSTDRPVKSDPILALVTDRQGNGWAVGGWGGDQDSAGRGTPVAADRARVQTAGVFRYQGEGQPAGPVAKTAAPVDQPAGPIRFAVGGHAQCESACADRADLDLAPDRLLIAALDQAAGLAAQPGGPRFFVNTGGRIAIGSGQRLTAREGARYAELLADRPALPVYTAASHGDTLDNNAAPFTTALAQAAAPFGQGALPQGTSPVPGIGASAGARTHYAFDSAGPNGTLRTVVIDNSAGSLAASDPHQNPAEPQLPWMIAVLDDARTRGIPAVVVGSRDLSRFAPRLNSATDGDEVAQVLVDHGASAYFFERPEENRAVRIPSGADVTIPAFGTGTLGYRSPVKEAAGQDVPLAAFGDRLLLLAEVRADQRDPLTNRAPVTVRGIPVVDDLSLQAVDGTLLRRSRPSLFQGLARKPDSGDRWGETAGDAGPSPAGGDPYTTLPAEQCVAAGCSSRIEPEFTFASSNPDIGDFVRQDPDSTNLRKPFIDPATDKVVTDQRSGLFCPFNAGTTTVTIRSGGVVFSQQVTVLAGTAARPCGTRPLVNPPVEEPTAVAPAVPAPSIPALAPTVPPTPQIPLPPAPPAPLPPAPPAPAPKAAKPKPPKPAKVTLPPAFQAALPPLPALTTALPPAVPPPPVGGFTSTIPPGGVTVRVMEETREEEVAPESSQAFSRYDADAKAPVGPLTFGAVLLLAAVGATVRTRHGHGRKDRRAAQPAYARARTHTQTPRRTR